jgi:hypothetical protein
MNLKPVILSNMAPEGKTIIEALTKQVAIGRQLNEEKEGLRRDQLSVMLTASRRAKLVSRAITLTLMAGFSALLLVGGFAGAGLVTTDSVATPTLKNLLPVVVGLAVVWGWYSWLTGKTVRGVTQQMEHTITLRIFTWLTGKGTLPE